MRRLLSSTFAALIVGLAVFSAPSASWAYPFWAQQNYDSPREATGKIVCRTNSSDASIRKLQFSPDNRRLLCAGRMKEICVVNVADGSVIQKLTGATSGSSYASDLIYLPDPRGAVSVGFGSTTGGLTRVWRLPD